jgi:hypothetical protein
MSDRVWMRCAELLISEFPPYPFPRPTMADVERFTRGSRPAMQELHAKVKVIRETTHWREMPGYKALGDIDRLYGRARAQWVHEVRRPDEPHLIHAESGERARKALAVALAFDPEPRAGVRPPDQSVAWRRMVELLRTGMNGKTVEEIAVRLGIDYERSAQVRYRIRSLADEATRGGVACEVSSERHAGGPRRVFLV